MADYFYLSNNTALLSLAQYSTPPTVINNQFIIVPYSIEFGSTMSDTYLIFYGAV